MSQTDKLHSYLKKHGTITPLDALGKLGIYRLAARVYELREAGHDVRTEIIETSGGSRVARYWLRSVR